MDNAKKETLTVRFVTNTEIAVRKSDPSFLVLTLETKEQSDHGAPAQSVFGLHVRQAIEVGKKLQEIGEELSRRYH